MSKKSLDEAAPSWHELVQPGPKGSEKRRQERMERRAARAGRLVPNPLSPNRAMRRGAQGRGWNPGRLVLHRGKPARPSGVALASPESLRGYAQRVELGIVPKPERAA